MKTFKIVKLSLALILITFLIACGGDSQEVSGSDGGEVYEFEFNIQPPAVHKFSKTVEEWADYVEEETDGQIVVNIYPSGALGPYESVYEDVMGGVYDIGYANPSIQSDTKIFPLSIGELPFSVIDPLEKRELVEKFNDKFLADDYDEVAFLAYGSSDPYQLVSTTPIDSIEDLKGLTINGVGEEKARLVELWGASPVSLSNSDLYEALERGTVDSVIYPAIGSVGYSFYEVAPYMTTVEVDSQSWVYLMNPNSLDRLPEDLKTRFIEEFAPLLTEMPSEMYIDEYNNSIEEFEEKGGEIISLDESDLEELRVPAKVVWDEWVEKANAKGYPGQEMMDYYLELLDEKGISSPYN